MPLPGPDDSDLPRWDQETTRVMSMPLPVDAFGEAPSVALPSPGMDVEDLEFADADLVEPPQPSSDEPSAFDFPPPPAHAGEFAGSSSGDAPEPEGFFDSVSSPPPPPGDPFELDSFPSPPEPEPPESGSPLLDFGPPPPAGDVPSPDDFGVDFTEPPQPDAHVAQAKKPSLNFGEVDFAEVPQPGSDPLEFDPSALPPPPDALEADLSAPLPPSPAAEADSLEVLSFIDDAAKQSGTAAKAKSGKRFHVRRRSGKVFGPFDEGVVVKMLEDGQLLGNEDVSVDADTWSPMASVPTLNEALQHLVNSPTRPKTSIDTSQTASSAHTMDRLKTLYEGRMAAVSVVDGRDQAARRRKRVPMIAAGLVASLILVAGLSFGLTRYGVFGLKKLWPATLSKSSADFTMFQGAKKALLSDTFKGYRDARDGAGRVLAMKEYPEVRAVWDQAVYYLQRRYVAASPTDLAQANDSLSGIQLLGTKNVEVVKALAGEALSRKAPAEALSLLLEARSRAENDSDVELALLLAETYALNSDNKSALDVLNKVVAKDKTSAKALHALGNLHQTLGEADAAAQAYADALAADPNHLISAVELGAVDLLVRHRVKEGLEAVDRALAEDKKSLLGPAEVARARALRGVALAGQFKPKEALAELDEALKLNKDSVFTKAMMGRVLIAQREFARAVPLFKEATTRDPQNLEYIDGYLSALIGVGKMEDALNAVSVANAHFPGNARIAFLYGRINDALDNTADAESHYKRAAAADPKLYEPNLALARLYLRFRRVAEAKPQLDQAMTKAPDSAGVHTGMGELAFAEGDLGKARQEFTRAVELNPTLADGHLGLSRVALAENSLPLAKSEIELALEDDAHLKEGRLQKGMVLWKLKQLDEAIAELAKAKDEDPKSAKIAINLGAVEFEKGDLPGAESALLAALSTEPSNPEANYYLALVKQKRAEYTQAIESMKNALERAPNLPSYHLTLGRIYRDAKRLPEAVEEWKTAAKLDPNYADAYEALGQVYLEQGDLEGAVKAFDSAMKADPARTRILAFVGDCYFQATKWEQAIQRYQQALRSDASLTDVYYKLGRAYTEEGKHAEAISWYQRATTMDKGNPMPFLYLGYAYKERGRKAEAVSAFKAYLARKPSAEDKKDVEDEIYFLQQER